jgi:hypothetical protein
MKVARTIQIMYKARMSRAIYCTINYSVKPEGDKRSVLSPCQLYANSRKSCRCTNGRLKPQDVEGDKVIKNFHQFPCFHK